jgi:hypothetical protein
MQRTILSLFVVLMLLTVGSAQKTDRRAALESLVAAERAFSKAAGEHGGLCSKSSLPVHRLLIRDNRGRR